MKKHLALILLILTNLIIGLITLPAYGESIDEFSQRSYAERTIQAVQSLVTTGRTPAFFSTEEAKQGSHGPAFMMSVVLLGKLILPDGTPIQALNFHHFLYFLAFQLGVVALYFLALRWVSRTAAFGAALLFCTQPVLLGHAFMNPKDVVFMSLFTASTALGFWMMDRGEKSYRPTGRRFPDGLRSFFSQFLWADVWLAGMLLGFTSAMRIAAPLVGIILLAYILLSKKWNLLPRFFAYASIAFCAMILFWPYLWPDPLGRLIGSILNSAEYPGVHLTLFNGQLYDSNQLPRLYLPRLLLVQLTETTLLLLLVGVYSFFKKLPWDLIVLIAIGFVLPAAAVFFGQVSLYNNFRQVFFVLPPLFLLAGLGLDLLFSFFRKPAAQFAILLLAVLPGLYATVTLYPYQYVYYNQLAGGVKGAYRVFDLDYWFLAYKDAQSYINQNASKHADILAIDTKAGAQTFARPDLIFNALGNKKKSWEEYDYIIVSTAKNMDQDFSKFPTVFVVERDGVPLVYVKKP